MKSFNSDFLKQIELEFRDQIERIIYDVGHIDHINSHQHCNTSPRVFEIACKLAKEYGIDYIRVPNERIVFTDNISKFFTKRFLINILKYLILKLFSPFNYYSARKYGIKTNDSFSGVLYTGFMDQSIIKKCIQLSKPGEILEILLHPCSITGDEDELFWPTVRDYVISHHRRRELEVLTNKKLLKEILRENVLITQYNLVDSSKPSLNHSKRINNLLLSNVSSKKSLRVFLVIDETTFFHPEFVNSVINEIDGIECIGACRVVLPKGGALQSYLLKKWKLLGLRDLVLLVCQTLSLRILGLFPKILRHNFYSSVKMVLIENQIPYLTISSINKEVINYISEYEPDIIISSNSLIFPKNLLEIPNIGVINRHSSLLPSYGGILPVFRAIQYNEDYCGASVHLMTEKIDDGTVLSRKWLPIEKGDSLFDLYKLLFILSFQATKDAIIKIQKQEFNSDIQDNRKVEKSYFSYPKTEDWIEFKKQ